MEIISYIYFFNFCIDLCYNRLKHDMFEMFSKLYPLFEFRNFIPYKTLIPLTIILPSANAAMEAKPDPIYNHIATSKGITGSSMTPLMPTSLGSKGDGNNRRWNFESKSGLRYLLCYHLQHLTNDKQRDTRRVCFHPWPIGAIATSSTITESTVESLLRLYFYFNCYSKI